MKIIFSNHLGHIDGSGRRTHLLRDWSGAMIPGNIVYPPVEMLYAAAYLRAHGCEVGLVDGNARHLSRARTVAEIKKGRPDCVLTVSSWFTLHDDLAFFRAVKEAMPGCLTIVAGPNVTLEPALALRSRDVDYVALGEFMDGAREIMSGRPRQNAAYREDGRVVVTPSVPIEPLDRIPFAAWDLVDRSLYWVPFGKRHPFALALAGVGCPHAKCTFCHQASYFGEPYRPHSPGYVIAEMDCLISMGFREVIYRDQCFTACRGTVEALCRHLIARGRPVTWRVSTRVDRVDRELLALMASAGCYQVSFGFESLSDAALARCRKGVTSADGERAASWAKEAGLELSGGFIVGLPGEEQRPTREWLRLIRRRGVDFLQVFPFNFVYDAERRRFHPYFEGSEILRENRRRQRELLLSFYLDPRYLAGQARRVIAREGFKRLPDFFLDFLRYVL
ncbi:MAG: radical SAM protein [Deltaproteobacteria bacterium]|nr:radical SAM protein [Deltaproteobacteria bacterium]